MMATLHYPGLYSDSNLANRHTLNILKSMVVLSTNLLSDGFPSFKYFFTYRQFFLLQIYECLIKFVDVCIVLVGIQASQGVLNEKEPC